MKKLIGRKVGMTQLFDEKGNVTGVTVIEAGPNFVTQVKTAEKDGYTAIQLGFGEVEARRLTRGELGHLGQLKPNEKHPKRKELAVPVLKHLEEARLKEVNVKEGDVIKADIFQVGEIVDVTGTMKGRGFAGGIKRHGFHRRVVKGQRMAGHYGNTTSTSMRLKVMLVDPERNLIAVRGSIPGAKGGIVVIREASKG
jgi:large subunit ribosomal protein L3